MFAEQTILARIIWVLLVLSAIVGVFEHSWSLAVVSLATLVISLAPVFVARWAEVTVPPVFIAAIVLFTGGTLFLGEVFDFYDHFWWWDSVMHASSAAGFGMIGFVWVFMMFQGDRYAAPHWAISFFAFCFAVTMGAAWEVFEFFVDMIFGLNMQETGLVDTMADIMVDMGGALLGAISGYAYLKGRHRAVLAALIADFVRRNPHLFKKWRK